MALSMSFYESEEKIIEEQLENLNNYFDNENDPQEVSMLIKTIREGGAKYNVYRIAKKVDNTIQIYNIKEGKVIPEETNIQGWNTRFAYIRVDSKYVYVSGSGGGWVSSFISNKLFGSEDKIKFREIDTKKLEEDIRKSNKFTPLGASFVDSDQTKVTLRNPSGIDFETNKHTKDIAEIEKNYLGIIIEKDDLNLNVLIYPHGKVTFEGSTKDRETALRIFLRIWSEIKDYN